MDKLSSLLCSFDDLPCGDFVSPNFTVINVDHCFPDKVEGNMNNITNPLFRKNIAHK